METLPSKDTRELISKVEIPLSICESMVKRASLFVQEPNPQKLLPLIYKRSLLVGLLKWGRKGDIA